MDADLPLFSASSRTDPTPQRARETTYQFLERVDDPVFERVRQTFNGWTGRFAALHPGEPTKDLVARFRSKTDQQFYAAFWELYLHEVHVRLGFEVEVHPAAAPGTRPDFFVSRGADAFYLEAVMPSPSTADLPAEPKSVRIVLEYVDAAFDPDFFLQVRFVTPGPDTPKKAAVVAATEEWLRHFEWDEWWQGEISVRYRYPEAELRLRGWVLGLRALPKPPGRRDDPTFPTIGSYPAMGGWPDSVADAMGPKLDQKASKYGDLDAPYVIALWVMSVLASARTAPQALFGIAMPLEPGRHRTGLPLRIDERDALWTANRQRRGRVSAVLAAPSFDFNYSAVSRVLPRLWLNPWAEREFTAKLPFPASHVSRDETMIDTRAATIEASSLLDLPPDWPGKPFSRQR